MLAIASKRNIIKKRRRYYGKIHPLFIRIDTNLKDNAEHSFSAWHFSIHAIQMLYKPGLY